MAGGERIPYRYTYSREQRDEQGPEFSEVETLRAIQASLQLLTGGCEICQNATGSFCRKHRRSFSPGEPRCDFFVRRLPEDPRKASKAQVQEFVNGVLGITDERTARRLIGYA